MPLEKLNAFTKKVSDLADKPNATMTAAEVKAWFDAAPDEVRIYLNKVIDSLQSVADGDSGADSIGVTPIATSPSNVQGMFEWLKLQIDELVLGVIPDGNITPDKLSFNPATQEELDEYILSLSSLALNKGASLIGIHDAGNYYESENVEGALQKIGATLYTPKPKVYGVRIDLTDSNPSKSVVWTDDAQGFTQPSDLDTVFPFNLIKPCMLRNGIVRYYLNPNNYAQKEDGTPSLHTDFAEGDVMVEFPKLYWSIKKDSNFMYVRISEQKVDADFVAMAHTIADIEKPKIYISAYAGSLDTTPKLRSTSGKSADVMQTLASYRTKIATNGAGYQQFGYYQMMLIQILFVIKYKSLNSDTALGKPSTFKAVAGSTDTAGMYSGNAGGTISIKFAGLEQIFSDYGTKVDGFISGNTSNNGAIYNDSGTNYENKKPSDVVLATAGGYISDVVGSNKLGFFPISILGSATSFFCDYISQNGGSSLFYNNSTDNGVFALRTITPADVSNGSYARLVYIG